MAAGSDAEWPRSPLTSEGDEEEEEEEEVEGREHGSGARRRNRFSLQTVGKSLASLASNVGESLARTAAAAGELLTDAELRTRSATLLTESAKKAGAGVAKGLQQGAGRIAAGPRTVQGVLQKLQQRIEEQRLQALLREHEDTPVDVQVAFQLYEDAPQELRSRLWMAVLEHPELVHEYQILAAELQRQRLQRPAAATSSAHAGSDSSSRSRGTSPAAAAGSEQHEGPQGQRAAEEAAEGEPRRESAAPAGEWDEEVRAEAGGHPFEQPGPGESSDVEASVPHSPSDPAHLSSSYSAPWAAQHVSAVSSPRPGHAHLLAPRQQQQQQYHDDESGWQMVSDRAAAWKLQGAALLAHAGEHPPYSREREGFRNILMAAMMSVPWPLPSEYPNDCRYATLLQISLGQEDIDEVITRDLHRTFPEHPLFAFEQGQQTLFNVLKAYALHDMEASYCQGMAFVAGLLLFYVPQEPAFQLFCRLLSTSGPNLRRLYLPGLEGLKTELRKLEFLMERFMPSLTAHLNAAGVVPVLFASQWLLTCYSCPFPVSFACRIIDVMLQENRDAILLKVAMAILSECEGDLLMQEGFEQLLTHLKADPQTWSPPRLRRLLGAALASPITQQDLAEADTAVEQGFTGSLSRAPTFSAEAEAAAAAGAMAGGAAGEGGGAMEDGPTRVAAGAAAAAAAPGSSGGGGSSGPTLDQEAQALQRGGGEPAAPAAGVLGGEDAVAADLAAAQQQIDDDLLQMVLQFETAWGGDGEDGAEESYSNTLHSAVQGSGSGGAQGG